MYKKILLCFLLSILLMSCTKWQARNSETFPHKESITESHDIKHARSILARTIHDKDHQHNARKIDEASTALDCWADKSAIHDQEATICREDFYSKIRELNPFLLDTPVVVYFSDDSHIVRAKEHYKVKHLAEKLKTTQKDYTVIINGHTDTADSDDHNLKLARQRAMSVRDLLEKFGVTVNHIQIFAIGEHDLAVKTKDNQEEALNRRVEIYVNM